MPDDFGPMRHGLLAGSFLALLAALVLLWNHRYERVPGLPTWRLEDLRAGVPEVPGVEWTGRGDDPALRLQVDSETLRVALRLAIPGVHAIDMLRLRYRMEASGLKPGKEKWDTGRMMVEWHPPDGEGEIEQDTVGGIQLDEKSGDVTLVAVPENGPAVPTLRLEHLGFSGQYELTGLEITAVRERALWTTGRWLLVSGWLVWFFACGRIWPGIARWRALAAAVIWLLMGIYFVVPGPWKSQRPLGADFQLGSSAQALPSGQDPPLVAATPPPDVRSGAVSAKGKLPFKGGLPLRIKLLAEQARPLLHILLLCAPTFASALLLGRKPTLFLAVLTGLAMEAAQVAFGYGFDWIDVLDLLTDASGIALGMWLAGRFSKSHDLRFATLRVNRT